MKLPLFDEPSSAWSGVDPFQYLDCFCFVNPQLNTRLFIDPLGMSTVSLIDEPTVKSTGSSTADQVVSNHKCCRPSIVKLLFVSKGFTMNTKLLLSAVAAAALSMAGGMAMADEPSEPPPPVVVAQASYSPNQSTADLLLERSAEAGTAAAVVNPGNTLTRAQVKAAFLAAQANGTLIVSDADSYWKVPASPSTMTREQVKASVAAAAENGELPQNDDSEYVDANAANAVGHMDRARS